jgi:hypothetical protein
LIVLNTNTINSSWKVVLLLGMAGLSYAKTYDGHIAGKHWSAERLEKIADNKALQQM